MPNISFDPTALLRLIQLADSALPIGSTAHSFGLETLAAEQELTVAQLQIFLEDYVQEVGTLEASFCCTSYSLSKLQDRDEFVSRWLSLNARAGAMKLARESRSASATLGRRFLQLVGALEEEPLLHLALDTFKASREDVHYCIAFGLVGGILHVDEMATVLAYLQQTVTGLVSACQRLLPLGQSRAGELLWRLKPSLIDAAELGSAAAHNGTEVACFTPLLDLASMRHPALGTRLFIS
jgi:urease accessory protein